MLAKGIYYISNLTYNRFHGCDCVIINAHKVLNEKHPSREKSIRFAYPVSGNVIILDIGNYIYINPEEFRLIIYESCYLFKKLNRYVISKPSIGEAYVQLSQTKSADPSPTKKYINRPLVPNQRKLQLIYFSRINLINFNQKNLYLNVSQNFLLLKK